VSATPIDITRVIKPNKPVLRVRYELQEIGEPTLAQLIPDLLRRGAREHRVDQTLVTR